MHSVRTRSTVLVALLMVAACTGGDEEAADPSPTPTPTTRDTADVDPAETDPAAQLPTLADTCTLPVPTGEAETVRIASPEGWRVRDGCAWFDPERASIEDGAEPSAAVSWRVDEVSLARAADVEDEVADPVRFVGARSGYQALRVAGEADGQDIRPDGEPVAMWLVDLVPGTGRQDATLIGTAHADGGVSAEVAAYALDRMAETIRVEPPASEKLVVTRLDDGGTPSTVTWTAGEGCFRLRAGGPDGDVVDRACGPSTPGSSGLRLVRLTTDDGARDMLAGITSSRIQRITVPAASAPSGATTQSTEGGRLFALPVPEPPFEVVAHDATGQVVTTLSFDGQR